jgi:hypothetical protein
VHLFLCISWKNLPSEQINETLFLISIAVKNAKISSHFRDDRSIIKEEKETTISHSAQIAENRLTRMEFEVSIKRM